MKKNRHFYIIALFFLLTLLSIATPYLHNHEADLREHEDCLAYMLGVIWSLGIVSIFLFYHSCILEFTLDIRRVFFVYDTVFTTVQPRAPPLSSLKFE